MENAEQDIVKAARLTKSMIRVMKDLRDGYGSHDTARSSHEKGGRYATVRALRSRGFIDDQGLSKSGLEVLTEVQKRQDEKHNQRAIAQGW